jgi:hypothetical protein
VQVAANLLGPVPGNPRAATGAAGLMVNSLYELAKVENPHEVFSKGQKITTRGVRALAVG